MKSKSVLKIVFMGTPEFAVPALQTLFESPYDLVGVVTVPDRVQGRGRKLIPSAVKQKAEALGLHIIQPQNIKSADFVDQIKLLAPDLIVVVAFQILPETIFTIPALGSFNLHASLLPRYRGAAPIHWALLNGDRESGVTTFFLKKRVDTGNIILQESATILPEDNLHSLYDKLCHLGAKLVLKTVDLIAGGSVIEVDQDNSLATPAPKVDANIQRLDFNESAEQCHNRIRAFSPKPGAFTQRNGSRLKILSSDLSEENGEAGEVLSVAKDSFTIACGSGAISIYEVQPESKKMMDAKAYLAGYPLNLGEILG